MERHVISLCTISGHVLQCLDALQLSMINSNSDFQAIFYYTLDVRVNGSYTINFRNSWFKGFCVCLIDILFVDLFYIKIRLDVVIVSINPPTIRDSCNVILNLASFLHGGHNVLYIFFSLLGIWFVLLLNNDVEYTVSSLMKYKRKKKKKSKPQKQVEVREQPPPSPSAPAPHPRTSKFLKSLHSCFSEAVNSCLANAVHVIHIK